MTIYNRNSCRKQLIETVINKSFYSCMEENNIFDDVGTMNFPRIFILIPLKEIKLVIKIKFLSIVKQLGSYKDNILEVGWNIPMRSCNSVIENDSSFGILRAGRGPDIALGRRYEAMRTVLVLRNWCELHLSPVSSSALERLNNTQNFSSFENGKKWQFIIFTPVKQRSKYIALWYYPYVQTQKP